MTAFCTFIPYCFLFGPHRLRIDGRFSALCVRSIRWYLTETGTFFYETTDVFNEGSSEMAKGPDSMDQLAASSQDDFLELLSLGVWRDSVFYGILFGLGKIFMVKIGSLMDLAIHDPRVSDNQTIMKLDRRSRWSVMPSGRCLTGSV